MPEFKEDGTLVIDPDEQIQRWQAEVFVAQENKGAPLTIDERIDIRKRHDPTFQTEVRNPAPRGFFQRFLDKVGETQGIGGRGEIGAVQRIVADATDFENTFQSQVLPSLNAEQREQLRDNRILGEAQEQRAVADLRDQADPAFREDGSTLGNLSRAGADLLGDTVGNANPTYLLGIGRNLIQRAFSQGAINASIDAGVQGQELEEGLRDEFSAGQTALQFVVGAALQGGNEAVVKFFSNKSDFLSASEFDFQDAPPKEVLDALGMGEVFNQVPKDITDKISSFSGFGRNKTGPFVEFNLDDGRAVRFHENPILDKSELRGPLIELDDPAVDSDKVLSKLTEELRAAQSLNKEQQELFTKQRKERVFRAIQTRQDTAKLGGESQFQAEKGDLAGAFDRVAFEGIRESFNQREVDTLFSSIAKAEVFENDFFGSISARTGLQKMLEGIVPARNELNALSSVFGEEIAALASDKRSVARKFGDRVGDVINVPRALMSSLDLSAPLRQGLVLATRGEWYTAFGSMFKQLGSEKAFNTVEADIKSRPTFNMMQEAGLSLTRRDGFDPNSKEDPFRSDLAKNIPGIGRLVGMSERAYVGFLNKLRADTFDSMVEQIGRTVDLEANPKVVKDIASYINSATGRGPLGFEVLENSQQLLNASFFSPRLMASRIALLNPAYYARLSPEVRRQAARDMISMGTVATMALSLAETMGADVETDLRSSDFGKIRNGTQRHDILGGFGQYITLASRLGTLSTKSISGRERDLVGLGINDTSGDFFEQSVTDTLVRFFRSKLSPVASFAVDAGAGENVVGEEFDPFWSSIERITPLFIGDVVDVLKEDGPEGLPAVLPTMFGVGYSNFDAVPVESKFNDLDDPTIQVLEELDALPSLKVPSTLKVNGRDVKLSDDEKVQYRQITESLIHEISEGVLELESFKNLSDDEKKKVLKEIQSELRQEVKEDMFGY